MRTISYYYVLAVFGAVFSLNSCDTIESKEKIAERNRAATTAYLSNMYGGLRIKYKDKEIDLWKLENHIIPCKNFDEVFICGGASIYKILMPYCKKMYITQIEENFDGDAFFPEIEKEPFR